jgi:hypothetical protein
MGRARGSGPGVCRYVMGRQREERGDDEEGRGKEERSALHMGENNALCINNSMCREVRLRLEPAVPRLAAKSDRKRVSAK